MIDPECDPRLSHLSELNMRKLKYRLKGWRELGHRNRCGHYWVNPKYPGQQFSIYEVAKVVNLTSDIEKLEEVQKNE